MANYKTNKTILNTYFNLQGSTTQFLKEMAQAPVQVAILKQQLCEQYLYRESLLFTSNSTKPLLYARCSFYVEQLTDSQLHALQHTNMPIGVILGVEQLTKQDHHITSSNNIKLMNKLAVTDECSERSFDLYHNDKLVANLVETVSLQSLSRLIIKPIAKSNLLGVNPIVDANPLIGSISANQACYR